MAAAILPFQACARGAALRAGGAPRSTGPSRLSLAQQPARVHQLGAARLQQPAELLLLRSTGARQARRLPAGAVRAQQQEEAAQQPGQPPAQGGGSGSSLGSVGLFLLWGGLVVYAFFFSPNQTPLRDTYILKTIVGLYKDDTFTVNAVFEQLFLAMGIYPLVYTALLIPAGRSGNGVPAWPFVGLSYGLGAFGLLPYMALWTPPKEPPVVPPAKKDLEGTGNLMARGMESPAVAALCLLGTLYCLFQAATAGGEAWADYLKMFDYSRFVHITSIDFLTLSALAPFWMYNDAQLRKWEPRDKVLPVLSLLPLLGPAIYLCLRPKAQQ